MAIKFGLTDKGFIAPTYEEWLDDVQDDLRSRLGNDIVLTSNSTLGIISRMIAWRETEMAQQLEMTYYAGFYSTATGQSLDRLGANVGIPRKVAMPSHVQIKIETDGEYLIQAGEQFETEDGYVFDLINDVITEHTSDDKWVGVGDLQSVNNGSMTNVEANTITVESDPDETILSVTNPEKAEGGQDDETDEDYRNRLILDNAAKPGPTLNGVKSALLGLSGVREVSIVENPTDKVDSYGNLPESVHIYVLGGEAKDIAQTLIDRVPAGAVLNGSQVVHATDASGDVKDVKFDYATDKPIYVKVDVTTNDDWNTDDGVNAIKSGIATSINSLEMGQTVFITKLYPGIYGVNGVAEATVQIGLDKDNLAASDITSERFEAPSCDLQNIEVVVHGS